MLPVGGIIHTSWFLFDGVFVRQWSLTQPMLSGVVYVPRPTNPYDAVRERFDSQTQEHQMHDIHSYAQASPMGVTVSPQPHWQPIWNGSHLTQLPYHATGPQIVPRHMIQLGAHPMHSYSGDPRHQHHMHEQGFDRVDYAEWGSSQGFQQYGVPGHSQYYQPEYSNPSAHAPVEGLLEDVFF